MSPTGIDTIMAGAAKLRSRRASLVGFGGALIAAAAMRPSPAHAGTVSKRVKKKCKRQITRCQSSVATYCATKILPGDREACEAELSSCCASFKDCQAGSVYACLIAGIVPPSPN